MSDKVIGIDKLKPLEPLNEEAHTEMMEYKKNAHNSKPVQVADSYTKDYSGSFPNASPLESINVKCEGFKVISIPRSLLETLYRDLEREFDKHEE